MLTKEFHQSSLYCISDSWGRGIFLQDMIVMIVMIVMIGALRKLAGNAIRNALKTYKIPLYGASTGATITVLIQSSNAGVTVNLIVFLIVLFACTIHFNQAAAIDMIIILTFTTKIAYFIEK